MKLIAGLGNIGNEYAMTKHNIGFWVADIIAKTQHVDFDRTERNALVAEFRLGTEKIFIIKPVTYMNDSGRAVGEFVRFYNIPNENIAVIHDDMDLPPGFIRIRNKGSSGGHNGIKSIQNHLGTDAFTRFKIGIGHPVHDRQIVIDHVLTKFTEGEKKIMESAAQTAAQAVIAWLCEDIEIVMNKFNTKKSKKDE